MHASWLVSPQTHHPIRFNSTDRDIPPRDNHPFRFEAVWLTREDYHDLWKAAWSEGDVCASIEDVMNRFKEWNHKISGNISKRKRRLEARISGIQKFVSYSSSVGLQRLEDKLKKELNEVLFQEEILWFPKSRRDLILDGDRNAKFYHRSTTVWKNSGRVRMLKIDGEWVSNRQSLSDHISNYSRISLTRSIWMRVALVGVHLDTTSTVAKLLSLWEGLVWKKLNERSSVWSSLGAPG